MDGGEIGQVTEDKGYMQVHYIAHLNSGYGKNFHNIEF